MDIVAPTVAVTLSLPSLFVPLSVLRVHPEQRREQLPRRFVPPPQNRTCTLFILDDAAAVAVTMVFIKELGLTRKTSQQKNHSIEYEGIARILRESSL